jgi:hypothetical protein
MKLVSLENVTRSQIKEMNYDQLQELVEAVQREAQQETWRNTLINLLENQEAQIVMPKVVS